VYLKLKYTWLSTLQIESIAKVETFPIISISSDFLIQLVLKRRREYDDLPELVPLEDFVPRRTQDTLPADLLSLEVRFYERGNYHLPGHQWIGVDGAQELLRLSQLIRDHFETLHIITPTDV
jgi:hypothetical protein